MKVYENKENKLNNKERRNEKKIEEHQTSKQRS